VVAGRTLSRVNREKVDYMTTKEYTGKPCPYCGKPLYDKVTEHVIGGGEVLETRTGPHCDTPICTDKRRQDQLKKP
jgi:hypothetical protein